MGKPYSIDLREVHAALTGWVERKRLERIDRRDLVDDEWLELKPKWERLRGQPVAFAVAWRKD